MRSSNMRAEQLSRYRVFSLMVSFGKRAVAIAATLALLSFCLPAVGSADVQIDTALRHEVWSTPVNAKCFRLIACTSIRLAQTQGTVLETGAVSGADLNGPDARGLRSDTYHFLAYQVATIGILYVMPESVSDWSDQQKDEYSLSKWWKNIQEPKWDDDDLFINYVTHPYWGAAYYVRARERGYGERSAFWYSALLSATYEFGAEALFENPSIQDLISTPVGGWLVGKYFMRVRDKIQTRHAVSGDLGFRDRAVLILTDPLGSLNSQVDSWFGLDGELTLLPYAAKERRGSKRHRSGSQADYERIYGITVVYRW